MDLGLRFEVWDLESFDNFFLFGFVKDIFPDPREDLESRSPNLGPILLEGTL